MTYFKECPNCGNKCYSASWRGSWTCPHCEKSLDDVEVKSIAELEEDDDYENNDEKESESVSGDESDTQSKMSEDEDKNCAPKKEIRPDSPCCN